MNKTMLFKLESIPSVREGTFMLQKTSAYPSYAQFIEANPNIEIISVVSINHTDILLTYKEE